MIETESCSTELADKIVIKIATRSQQIEIGAKAELPIAHYYIQYEGDVFDLYFNVLDDGFSTYLHKNCLITSRRDAERTLKRIQENPMYYLDRIMD